MAGRLFFWLMITSMPLVLIVDLSAFKDCSRLSILTAANNYYKKTGLKK
jgi:hypothetical protein